jgi:serine/threonine protein phosphatase PrpC
MVLLPLKNMHIEFAEITDVGKVRKANEDSLGNVKTAEGHVFVVSDGMGGHVGGATASALAVKCILEYFAKPLTTDPATALAEAIQFANTQVYATALHDIQLHGMGATCVVLYLSNDGRAWYGHVGDSRIYHQRGNDFNRLTKDHSWVQFLVDTGEISPDEAETHPEKNRILRALGIEDSIRPDVCAQPIELRDGDRFLLCSDGLSGLVNDKELLELGTSGNMEAVARACVDLALERGGNDNISVSLLQVSDTGKTITLVLDKKRTKGALRLPILLGIVLLAGVGGAWWLAKSAALSSTGKVQPDSMLLKKKDSVRNATKPKPKEEQTAQPVASEKVQETDKNKDTTKPKPEPTKPEAGAEANNKPKSK